MSIKKLTNPYLNRSKTKSYLFDYIDAQGVKRQKSLKTTNLKEAYKNLDEFIMNLKVDYVVACKQQEQELLNTTREPIVYHQRQIGSYPVSINESFNSAFQDFIDSKENRSARTRSDYTYVREMLRTYGFNWIHLEKSMFKKFLIYLKNTKKYSPITIAKRMVLLKCFLNYCVRFEILPENLVCTVARVMPALPTNNQGHSKIIPNKVLADIFALIKRDKNYEFAYYLFVLYMTASRPDEIRLLMKSLYHQKHGTLTIRQFKTSDWKLMEQMNDSLKWMLDELVKSSDSEYFFPKAIKNKHYFSNQWRKYMKESKLIEPKDKYGKAYCTYEMRCLRHTSATAILANSKNWDIVRNALGHSVGTPNFKKYTGVSVQDLDTMSSNNMGMSRNKNTSRYTQCTKIMSSPVHKKLSENRVFTESGFFQPENTRMINSSIEGLSYKATKVLVFSKSDPRTFIRPRIFPKVV